MSVFTHRGLTLPTIKHPSLPREIPISNRQLRHKVRLLVKILHQRCHLPRCSRRCMDYRMSYLEKDHNSSWTIRSVTSWSRWVKGHSGGRTEVCGVWGVFDAFSIQGWSDGGHGSEVLCLYYWWGRRWRRYWWVTDSWSEYFLGHRDSWKVFAGEEEKRGEYCKRSEVGENFWENMFLNDCERSLEALMGDILASEWIILQARPLEESLCCRIKESSRLKWLDCYRTMSQRDRYRRNADDT